MDSLISSDSAYREWLIELSNRYRSSQIRATVKVNEELLRVYWESGCDIVETSDTYTNSIPFIASCL